MIGQSKNRPDADAVLAERAKSKDLLGYHDILLGNEPDAWLTKFISENLPAVLGDARTKLDKYRDLLWAFATNEMPYAEFAARVRRRFLGQKEDNYWDEIEPESPET